MTPPRRLAAAALAAALFAHGAAEAAEGASSHYLPGVAGDLGFALPPEPGVQLVNIAFVQSGDVGAAVLQGAVNTGLDLTVALDLVGGFYTFDGTVLGARYTLGALVPFGHASLEATVTGPGGNTFTADADSFNLSDVAFVPVQLTWSAGTVHFKLSETVIAPTGGYDVERVVNLGRNYWSFDTQAAVTWLNPGTGTEVSVQPGIMLNTRNDATDYRTGAEFHVDFVANQFLAETVAVGLRGYYYRQVTGDSGSGALLGDFKSESLGLGGGVVWTPGAAGGALAIAAKAMVDLRAEARFDSTYGLLTVGWRF